MPAATAGVETSLQTRSTCAACTPARQVWCRL